MSGQREDLARHERSRGEMLRERLVAGLPVTERRLDISGVATAVLDGGEGPPVVFVQCEHAFVWLRVLSDIVETHRVVVPDLPGLGETELPAGRYDLDTAMGWLGELVERTCDTPPVLVAKGPAGTIAARFAADHGERVAGLVLVDTHGLEKFRPRAGMALSYFGVMLRPTQERVERSLGTYCFTDLERVRADLGERWDWFAAYTAEFFRTPRVKKAMRTLLPRLGQAIPPADLARICVPTTLIWGRKNLATPVTVAEDASARHGWPLHVIDGARDDPALEQPEAFLEALRTALA